MEKDIPRRPGMGKFDLERGGGHGFRQIILATSLKLLPNVLCSTGGTKCVSKLLRVFMHCSDQCSRRRLFLWLCASSDWLDQESSADDSWRCDSTVHVSGVLHEETLDKDSTWQGCQCRHNIPLSPGDCYYCWYWLSFIWMFWHRLCILSLQTLDIWLTLSVCWVFGSRCVMNDNDTSSAFHPQICHLCLSHLFHIADNIKLLDWHLIWERHVRYR